MNSIAPDVQDEAQLEVLEQPGESMGNSSIQYAGPWLEDLDDILQGERLRLVLDEIFSPKLSEIGLTWNGRYDWIGPPNELGVRRMVSYLLLRMSGVITWGLCFDFVKIPSGKKLVYNRTEKSAQKHLFEWPEGYNRSFMGEYLGKFDGQCIGVHVGSMVHGTLSQSIELQFPNILAWFEKTETLDGIVDLARSQHEKQGPFGFAYGLHYPSPGYVLAHLYARMGRLEEAIALLDEVEMGMEQDTILLVRKHLQSLSQAQSSS